MTINANERDQAGYTVVLSLFRGVNHSDPPPYLKPNLPDLSRWNHV